MRFIIRHSLFVLIAALLMQGCTTLPAPEGATSSARYVGDRATTTLDEIVVSVPMEGVPGGYQNLHVTLSAIINPKNVWGTKVYEVRDIVRRLQPRVASNIVSLISQKGTISLASLPSLRDELAKATEGIVKTTISQWTRADEYEIEILVTSLFLTDASVGKPEQTRFWW